MSALDAAALLRQAREGAPLTQRELARRARTSQSVVARIENGSTSPSVTTLSRLLKAAGFGVTVELTPALVEELRTLGRREGTTLFMTLLAGWQALLARHTGQSEVVVGTPGSLRPVFGWCTRPRCGSARTARR